MVQMTYGDLYHLFVDRNKDLQAAAVDYRPGEKAYEIQVWFKDGGACFAKYNVEDGTFTIRAAKEPYWLLSLRDLVYNEDIPHPTVPEYVEHHRSIQKILNCIDKELLKYE